MGALDGIIKGLTIAVCLLLLVTIPMIVVGVWTIALGATP